MNSTKRSTLGLMLGLTIALAGISYAQSSTQTDPNKKSDCCSAAMGCCAGDSCQMMKKDAAKNHATAADKNSCCGCCGDSCQMMKKDGMKNHATSSSKEGCCCCGDSCEMKDEAKTAATSANAASAKHECCCCGDSCDMKDNKDAKAAKVSP